MVWILSCLVLLLAIVSRLRLNTVDKALPNDERVYMAYATAMQRRGGYRTCVDSYLGGRGDIPNPLRWGHLFLTGALFRVFGARLRTLTTLSSVAGILSVALTGLIGLELGGPVVGLLASALTLSSPLQCHLGRRALQDELVCCLTLASVYAVCVAPQLGIPGLVLIAVAVWAQVGVKEASVLSLPALGGLLICRGGTFGWCVAGLVAIGSGVALSLLTLLALNRCDWRQVVAIHRHTTDLGDNEYAVRHGRGPWHRYLIEFVTLSPLVVLLAVAGAVHGGAAALYAALFFASWSAYPWRNLRAVVAGDSVLRIVAASAFAASPLWIMLPVAALVWFTEWRVFRRVFLIGGLYEPIPRDEMHLIGMM